MKIVTGSRKKVMRSSLNFTQPVCADKKIFQSPVRRSQLIENNGADSENVFQNWLLRTGHSPKAGLPASQIGIYTDFQ